MKPPAAPLPLSQRLATLLHPVTGMLRPRPLPSGYTHPRRHQYPHDRVTDNRGAFYLRLRDHGVTSPPPARFTDHPGACGQPSRTRRQRRAQRIKRVAVNALWLALLCFFVWGLSRVPDDWLLLFGVIVGYYALFWFLYDVHQSDKALKNPDNKATGTPAACDQQNGPEAHVRSDRIKTEAVND